jgi:carboxylate-amine ligase
VGVGLGNVGSGASWRQALWVGCAMTPMSSIALLIASQFVVASPSTGHLIARVALPAILLMEVLGAVIATVAIYRAGEAPNPGPRCCARPQRRPRMSLEAFHHSEPLTLGVELELQLVNTHDYDLAPYAEDMLRLMKKTPLPGSVVPEMTNSMIEISTGICHSASEVLGQLSPIRDALVKSADKLNIAVVGGGTHPFQQWHERRIYDKPRFRELSELYGYLSKQFTIFGQHVHIGCPDADAALLMLHRMSRYIPHFIALSASSPYVQGQDTAFDSARLNSVFAFPLSGRAPFVLTWDDFTTYFDKMTRTGVVKSMKDFYWDIRPKPEFGTIEIRVFDTPLTIERAAALAGFVQSLGAWFLAEQPFMPKKTTTSSTPTTASRPAALAWTRCTWTRPRATTCRCASTSCMTMDQHRRTRRGARRLERAAPAAHRSQAGQNDARWLRERQREEQLLAEVSRQAALRFRGAAAEQAATAPTRHRTIRPMGEFDLIARYFTRPVRRAALGVGDDCALLAPAPRHAAGHLQRHAGRRPPLLCRRGPRAPGPQGPGRQPVGPGGLRRPAAGFTLALALPGPMRPGCRLFARACWRWPTRTAASWWAATPRRAR